MVARAHAPAKGSRGGAAGRGGAARAGAARPQGGAGRARGPLAQPPRAAVEAPPAQSGGVAEFERPDASGRFGRFGGKYVPETLMYALQVIT